MRIINGKPYLKMSPKNPSKPFNFDSNDFGLVLSEDMQSKSSTSALNDRIVISNSSHLIDNII